MIDKYKISFNFDPNDEQIVIFYENRWLMFFASILMYLYLLFWVGSISWIIFLCSFFTFIVGVLFIGKLSVGGRTFSDQLGLFYLGCPFVLLSLDSDISLNLRLANFFAGFTLFVSLLFIFRRFLLRFFNTKR